MDVRLAAAATGGAADAAADAPPAAGAALMPPAALDRARVRLWNELILATTPSAHGIEIHYDRGSYSHLEDDEMGVSSWMLLADMDTAVYGQALAPLNMSMIPEHVRRYRP